MSKQVPEETFSSPEHQACLAERRKQHPLNPQPVDEGMLRLAQSLSRAHIKYFQLFGVEPHGTIKQLMAMLEMCPEAKEYIRLYEKQRTEMLTV